MDRDGNGLSTVQPSFASLIADPSPPPDSGIRRPLLSFLCPVPCPLSPASPIPRPRAVSGAYSGVRHNGAVKRLQALVGPALVAVAVLALYRPVIGFELMGDDYQWLQLAHAALHRPALLLADLDTFYRPASTWTLAADRLLWGWNPAGFHLTNLLLHAAAAVLLGMTARRLGLGRLAAWAVALLWACSPFALEPAVSVAIRFESLLLLAWLGLALSWPGPETRWTGGRVAAVAALVALAAASKETWVVTPGLVWALERWWRRATVRSATRTAAIAACASAAYTLVYFLAFPGGKGYFRLAPEVLAKIPHQLAAFLHFETLLPLGFRWSWKGVLATAIVAAAGILAVRRASPAGAFGLALLALPVLPTLLVPYLPTRYTAIPYAGFLMLVAASLAVYDRELAGQRRAFGRVGASLGAGAVLLAGALTVRADVEDFARVSAAHRQVLAEAARAVPGLPRETPFFFRREDRDDPLRAIALSVRGLPKIFFPRPLDPYGLADVAALLEWSLRADGVSVVREASPTGEPAGPVPLLIHRSGAFVWSEWPDGASGPGAGGPVSCALRSRALP